MSSNPFINGLLSGGGWTGSSIVWGVADNPSEGLFWINGTQSAVGIALIFQNFSNVIATPLSYGGWWSNFAGAPLDITITFTTSQTYALLGLSPNSDGGVVYPYVSSGDSALINLGGTRSLWPQPEGDIGLNINQQANYTNATPGSFGWYMGLYLGAAALGLKPPQALGPGNSATYASLGISDFNTPLWTVMSSAPTYNGVYPSTLMPGDILALQYLYGANTTTLLGDTDHVFANDGQIRAIYDAGGVDTLNGSALTSGAVLDLRQLGYSYVGSVTTVAIASGVVIENAAGGSGSDRIIGNSSNNQVDGNGGLDTLVFDGSATAATFGRQLNGTWLVSAGSNGTDTLNRIEFLEFTNRILALRPAEGSIDGNGTTDIILRNTNGTIALWTQNGATTTSAQIVAASDPNFTALGQGDFNGDGRFDILFRNAGGILAQWQMNGASVSAVGAYVTDPNWTVAGIGDFNGDFRDDILWRNSSGLLAQWQMDGLAASAVGVFAASDPTWSVSQIADFNGDGRDDILWRNSSGLLALWQMNGFAVTSAGVIATSDPTWAIVGTGDFNGDLREDILWRSSTGVLAQWTMDGASVTGVGTFAVSDTAWSVSDIGDYNGDGRDDILWQGPDGTFALWTLNGFSVTSAGVIGNPGAGWTDLG
jgi:hypothetical protein